MALLKPKKSSKTKKKTKDTTSSKSSNVSAKPKSQPKSVEKSWTEKYDTHREAVERVLWGTGLCGGRLRGGTLGAVKKALRENGPDALLTLHALVGTNSVGKKQLVKELRELLNS